MKTVDNAFLRAYNRSQSKSTATVAELPGQHDTEASSQTVEEIYSEGAWYRLDSPRTPVSEPAPDNPSMGESTSWYDPPWSERTSGPHAPEVEDNEWEEVSEQLSPWDAPSFMVMPGVDDTRLEDFARATSGKKGRTQSKKSAGGTSKSNGEAKPPKAHRNSASKIVREETLQIVPELESSITEDVSSESSNVSFGRNATISTVEPPEDESERRPKPQPSLISAPPIAEPQSEPKSTSEGPDIYQLATNGGNARPAAWEVTRFIWPEVCDRLEKSNCLVDVGEKLKSAAANGLKALAVTSTHRGEGASTVAVCLARSAATAGLRVAIVDADSETPLLANTLGVDAACSWDETILQNLPVSESAVASIDDGVTLFPRKRELPHELALSDVRVADMIHELASQFDIVIVDVGVLPNTVQQFFVRGGRDRVSPIHGTAVVRDVRSTSIEQITGTVGRLRTFGVEQVAIVENFGMGN